MAEFNPKLLVGAVDDLVLPMTHAAKPSAPHAPHSHASKKHRKKGAGPDASAPTYEETPMAKAEQWAGYGMNAALLVQLPAMFGVSGMLRKFGWHGVATAVDLPNTYTFAQAGEALGVSHLVSPVAQGAMEGLSGVASLAHPVTSFFAARNEKAFAKTMGKMQEPLALLKETHSMLRTPEVKGALGQVLTMVHAGPGEWHTEGFAKAVESASEGLAKVHGAEKASGALAQLHKLTGKADLSHFMANGYRDLPNHIRKGGVKAMAETPISHGLLQNGAFLFFGLASAYHTGYDLNKKMQAAQRLMGALTGKKERNASWTQVMMGAMPNAESGAVMGAIRHGLIQEFGPAAIAEAVNTAINIRMTASHRLNNIMVSILFSMASSMWRGMMGESVMPAYMTLTQAESQHQPIPAEAITAFLGQVVPPLRARGAEKSHFAIALGEEYAKEHAAGKIAIDGIVAEIGNGALMKRLAKIQEAHAHDAPAAASPTPAHEASPKLEHAPAALAAAPREAWRKHLENAPANFRERHDVAAAQPHGVGV